VSENYNFCPCTGFSMKECDKGRGRIAPCFLNLGTKRAVSDQLHSLRLTAAINLEVAGRPESQSGYMAHESYCTLPV